MDRGAAQARSGLTSDAFRTALDGLVVRGMAKVAAEQCFATARGVNAFTRQGPAGGVNVMKQPFRYLTTDEVTELHKTAVNLGLAQQRDELLRGIDAGFVYGLRISTSPSFQLSSDLDTMVTRERLNDGSVPLLLWLSTALRATSSLPESEVFKRMLAKVEAKAGLTAPIAAPPPAPPPRAPPPPARTNPGAPGGGLQKAPSPMSAAPKTSFPRDISGGEYKMLNVALAKAFPSRRRLEKMLQFQLGKDLNEIAAEGINITDAVYDVIKDARADGWLLKLVKAARASSPGNPDLIEFCQGVGMAPAMPPQEALERFLKKSSGFLDPTLLRTRLGEVEGQVCCVEVGKGKSTNYGTGFLVGPDLVITNHHVMERVIDGSVPSTAVTLRFDYKHLASGQKLHGTPCKLASDWLVDQSPPSASDGHDEAPDPSSDELDYALLRLATAIGDAPLGEKAERDAPLRGWIAPAERCEFSEGDPLFIVQHPEGKPIQVALDTDAILGVNGSGTRVRYTTNTEHGSSGSPCFNERWELVALHHFGDPSYHDPKYNQGIPFDAIVDRLAGKGITFPPLPASAAH